MRSTTWFTLLRHDGEGDPPKPPDNPPAPPAPDKTLNQADVDRIVADRLARERQKFADYEDLKVKATKLDEIEAANATEAEKLAAKAEAAEKKASEATARAVKAEVKALAEDFADREDAVLNLGDLSKYTDAAGDIDTAAIKADLAEVLDRKKHLAKAVGPRNPAPDPSQGRGGNNGPTDYRTAPKAEFDAELAKLGLRPRSYT